MTSWLFSGLVPVGALLLSEYKDWLIMRVGEVAWIAEQYETVVGIGAGLIVIAFVSWVIHRPVMWYINMDENRHLRQHSLEDIRRVIFRESPSEGRLTLFVQGSWLICFLRGLPLRARWFLLPRDKRRSHELYCPKPDRTWSYLRSDCRAGVEANREVRYLRYSKKRSNLGEGVATEAFQKDESRTIFTPPTWDIEGDIEQLRRAGVISRNLQAYMERTRATPYLLKYLTKPARHFHCEPIYNGATGRRGVLVIDSWHDESPFTDEVVAQIKTVLPLLGRLL